ncbi:hypothetical protein AFLA_009346 [Aspergillus flavus NRRL3357]|nr:hypothetical protein AFLA_009346 [Aspergillus flavus NRRL3357]
MKNKSKGRSKGKGMNKLKKDHTNNNNNNNNNKDSIGFTTSSETITEVNSGRLSEITTQIETSLRIEDDALNKSLLSKTEDINAETTKKENEANTNGDGGLPRVGSLKRRLKMTFTGSPLKLPGDSDRHSCHIHSQDKVTRSERSGSGTASLTDSNTIGTHGSIHSPTKQSPTTPPTPKYLKYIRATNDYIFLDLDFLETDNPNKVIQGGSLSAMEDTKRQAPGVSPSGKRPPETGDKDIKKGLQKQIDQVRSLTGTEVKTVSSTDSKSPRRVDDSRQWNTVNLRCTTCRVNLEAAADVYVRAVVVDAQVRCVVIFSARNASQILGNSAIGTIEDMGLEVNRLGYGRHTGKASCLARRSDRYDTTTQRQPTTSRCASPTFKMRTYDDSFSGQKIYPGKGKLYVRGDSKIFRFQNGKSESLFLQRKNPRRISWTVLYRRQHKKGISEEVAKKRTRRAVKSQRAIVGASLDVIKERRNQRPEARAAARQQAIKDAKEKKAASEKAKKAEKAKNAAAGKGTAQRIQSKQGAKGSAPKVAAKSR